MYDKHIMFTEMIKGTTFVEKILFSCIGQVMSVVKAKLIGFCLWVSGILDLSVAAVRGIGDLVIFLFSKT